MIEALNNSLIFSFPNVHKNAQCQIGFQRTLRIPDDNREYPLPPGLGDFPIEHVDDYNSLPATWHQHGGVFIPMYQSEALWINFSGGYPCAIKIAAGKINAVSGEAWTNTLSDDPQDYVVVPEQPWLDGFNVSEGYIRQFVAMPLGQGYTAEEQITGKAEHGGLQIIAYPMKKEVYKRLFESVSKKMRSAPPFLPSECAAEASLDMEMGLAPGGLMRQEIYNDPYGIDAWDQENGFRCFVHLANSELYQNITGHAPPHKPCTAEDYTNAGLPWFDYYSDAKPVTGSKILSKLKSLAAKKIEKGEAPLDNNKPVEPKHVKVLGKTSIVRDGKF